MWIYVNWIFFQSPTTIIHSETDGRELGLLLRIAPSTFFDYAPPLIEMLELKYGQNENDW